MTAAEVEAPPRPQGFSFRQATQLVDAVWQRDSNRRQWVGVCRHLYRTGKFERSAGTAELSQKALWDRTDKWQDAIENQNFLRQHIDIITSAVAGSTPDVSFDPATPSDPHARQDADYVGALVSGFVEEDNVGSTLLRMAYDASISGHGFGHVRWLRRVRPTTKAERDVFTADAREAFRDAMRAEAERLRAEGIVMDPSAFEPGDGDLPEPPEETVVVNRPTCEYVSPAFVLVPSDVAELADTPWYGVVRMVRLSDLRADDTLNQEVVAKLKGERDEEAEQVRRLDEAPGEDKIDPIVKVVFFYDVRFHKLIIYPMGGKEALYDGANPNEFDDVCLVDIRGYRDGEQFFGFGDLEGIAATLEKVAVATKRQLANLVHDGPVLATWEKVLSDADKAKLKSFQPGDLVELSRETLDQLRELFPEGNVTPDMILHTLHTATPLDHELYQLKAELKADASEIAGVSEFMRGGLGPPRMPGTAAAAAEGWSSVRISVREQSVNHAFKRICELFYKLCQQHLDEGEVVHLVGPMGENWDETVQLSRLSKGFYVQVRTGSMSASNPAVRAQRGREAFDVAMQLEDRGWDVEGLLEVALRDRGIDPRMARLRKLPPPPEEPPAGGVPAGAGAGPDGDVEGLEALLGAADAGVSTQDQMVELGGPMLPGESGDLAF